MAYISYIADVGLFNHWLWPVVFPNSFAPLNGVGSNAYFSGWDNYSTNAFTALGVNTPTGAEDPDNPDYRFPHLWAHIEDGNTRIQGVALYRQQTNLSDNVRIMQRNGVDILASILAALSAKESETIEEQNLIGVAQLPMTDRLT